MSALDPGDFAHDDEQRHHAGQQPDDPESGDVDLLAEVLTLASEIEDLLADQPLDELLAGLEEREDTDPLAVRQTADATTLLRALRAYRLTARPVLMRLEGDEAGRTREDL